MGYIKIRDVTLIGISLLSAVELCEQEFFCLKLDMENEVVFGVGVQKNLGRIDKDWPVGKRTEGADFHVF